MMKGLATICAVAAIMAAAFATSAQAQGPAAPNYDPANPIRIGSWCKVITDTNDGSDRYGYYERCGEEALASAPRRKHRKR